MGNVYMKKKRKKISYKPSDNPNWIVDLRKKQAKIWNKVQKQGYAKL